jgi:translation initiation factor IF-1
MSALSRKNVVLQMAADFPEPSDTLAVARILSSKGGDHFEVELPHDDDDTLHILSALMPSKFMNLVWVKKGDLVMVEVPDLMDSSKASLRIAYILTEAQLKHIIKLGKLPAAFMTSKLEKFTRTDATNVDVGSRFLNSGYPDDDDSDFDLPSNPNHTRRPFEDSSSSDDE